MAFPYPLLLTSLHFLFQWIFSYSACMMFPVALGSERVTGMGWEEWFLISLPCGVVTSLDIGLSNLSMVSITITFYTMVKSSTPIFVLGWAYMFGIEKITFRLIGVVLVIAAGEFLTVLGEVDFKLHGFLLCLSASVLSGARWTLVQLKLQTMEPPLKTTIVTMRLLSPCMFWSMLLLSLMKDWPYSKLQDTEFLAIGLGLIGGTFATAMVLCEFYLILKASAIILMIGGVIKEMITIFVGISFFGDKLNLINATGCSIVFLGVFLYKLVFHLEKEAGNEEARIREALQEKNKKEDVGESLLSGVELARRKSHSPETLPRIQVV